MESIIQETTFELSRVSDRRDKILENIQQALLLIYGQQINTPAAKKLFNTIQISQDAIFLMRTIAEETKNLQILKEREARRGGRDYLSVGDIRDIEETELRIERLRQELHELERLSKPGL